MSRHGKGNIELVIFDCDGVLIDSEIISARMLQEEAAQYGIEFSTQHVMTHYLGRSFPKVIATIEEQFSLTLPDSFETDYRTRLTNSFESELNIIPGVEEVIRNLAVPSCIATSSSKERMQRSLEIVGLDQWFEGPKFNASMVENGKPAPDLFLLAASEMGVDPAKCLVIEDSKSGILAGLAAGMKTIRFTGGSHLNSSQDSAGAELVFDKFEDFFNYYPELKIQIREQNT